MADRRLYPCGVNYTHEILRNPTSEQLFAAIVRSPSSMTMIIVAILLSALTLLVFLEGEFYICRRIPGRRKVQLSFIMGIYPVFSITSLLTILVPRAAIITKFTAQIYMAVALFQFIMLINNYYGGREKMLAILEGVEIPIASPPCLCCCRCCIPKTKVTKNNINKFVRRTRTAVLQCAIIKPILWFIATVLWTNGSYRPGDFTISSAYLWLQLFATISTITALQGLIILYQTSREPLKDFKLRPKFFTVQMALVITNVQSLVISLVAAGGHLRCKGPYPPGLRALYIESIITIVEMFFFMILAMIWYRRLEGNVDKEQLYQLMSKRYAKIRDSYAKNDPTGTTQLTLQDQMDCESVHGTMLAEADATATPPHSNGFIPNGNIPNEQDMERTSLSSKRSSSDTHSGMCLNEVVMEETDHFPMENGGAIQALWLHRSSAHAVGNGHLTNGFLPSPQKPKRWSDNEYRLNWNVVQEVADRESDV